MSLASLYFRGGDFLLKWKGHFSFWCSAQKFLGRWRGESEFRHGPASTPAKLTEPPYGSSSRLASVPAVPFRPRSLRPCRICFARFGFSDFSVWSEELGRVSSKEETGGIPSGDVTLAVLLPFSGNGSFGGI